MPNHIINIITVRDDNESDDFEKIREFVSHDDHKFDFNQIIPAPEDIFQGSLGEKEREKYGDKNWYDWNTKNWGTKWNAYDVRVGKYYRFIFQTAWAHPFPVIKALSEKFPKTTFSVAFADEDWGNNLGAYLIKNGKTTFEFKVYKAYSKSAKIFADICWASGESEHE